MYLYIVGAIICASIIGLMALDIAHDLRQSRQRILNEIKALPKDAKLTEEQREWMANQCTNT